MYWRRQVKFAERPSFVTETEEEVVELFKRWAQNPKVRDWICRDCLSPEERARHIREIFGIEPEAGADAGQTGHGVPDGKGPNPTESNQIKPDEKAELQKLA